MYTVNMHLKLYVMYVCVCVTINQVAGEEVKLDPGAGLVLSSGPTWCAGDSPVDPDSTEGVGGCCSVMGTASPASPGGGSEGVSSSSLSHTLESLSRPVLVTPPPPRTLVFVWLLAAGVPRAQVSIAICK